MTTDADRLFAFLDLDLGDAGLIEQLDQLLDLADVHLGVIPRIANQLGSGVLPGFPAASWWLAARSASS